MMLTGYIRDLGAALPGIRLASDSNKTVTVKIISRISSGTYTASILGKRITVRSSLDLPQGARFRASVLLRGGSVILKTAAPGSLRAETGLSLINQARGLAAETLTRAHIPLSADIIAAFAEFAAKYKAAGKEQLRLAALLFDKGLKPGEDDFRLLKSFVNPLGGRDGGEGRENGRRGRDEDSRRRDASVIVNKLKRRVKAAEETSPPVLLLFNHMRGSCDNWVVIPFTGDYGASGIAGVIRLKPGDDGKTIMSLVISVSKDGFSCHFSIPRYDVQPRQMKLYIDGTNPVKPPEEILLNFKQNIEKFRCVLDDTINTNDDFDGFSELSGNPYTDIDFEV